MRNTLKHEHNAITTGGATSNLANFTNCMSIDLRATVAEGKVYGILLAVFDTGTMPCLDLLKEGIEYHKTQWLANNKVLYEGW
jgi:hypothetical protein